MFLLDILAKTFKKLQFIKTTCNMKTLKNRAHFYFEFPHIFDLLGGIQNKSQVVALLGLFQIRQGANHAYITQQD